MDHGRRERISESREEFWQIKQLDEKGSDVAMLLFLHHVQFDPPLLHLRWITRTT